MKTCTGCSAEKPHDDFSRDNRRKDGRMARCKACRKAALNVFRDRTAYNTQRYWNDPQGERERHLIRKYGITQADYERMFAAQDGKCAICRKSQDRAFDVDHCHSTGKVRGLLCTSCNRMIGHAGDNPATLIAGAEYLCRSVPEAAAEVIAAYLDTERAAA